MPPSKFIVLHSALGKSPATQFYLGHLASQLMMRNAKEDTPQMDTSDRGDAKRVG